MEYRLVTVCPSRNRPELALKMVNSWNATKAGGSDTHMVIYISDCEPQLLKYQSLLSGIKDLTIIINNRISVGAVFNLIPSMPDFKAKFYQNINDDHFFHTNRWDDLLIAEIEKHNGWGVAAPDDMYQKDWYKFMHPSAEVYSANIYRTLGHIFSPRFQHLGLDEYLKWLCLEAGILYHVPSVQIEHCHGNIGKNKFDENYQKIYTDLAFLQKEQQLRGWMRQEKAAEVRALREAMMSDRA